MSKYIDADKLIKTLYIQSDDDGFICCGAEELDALIQAQPNADVFEVVRCKECVHCADDWNGNQPMFTCELAKCGESVYPTDFCSYGERSEDEQIH